MSDPAPKRRATYQDILDAPEHEVAEIIGGELRLSPRPGAPATEVASVIGEELGPPFKRGRGGPGGWIILDEPEVHLGEDVLVPDLAGWRRDRLPVIPDEPYFTLRPDWICEVLSPSTERTDRAEKLPIYASVGVRHAWLVHPRRRTLEAYRLQDGRWLTLAVYKDADKARIEPFDAIEFDLALLWADVALPTRASDAAADDGYAVQDR
jgi:Uma2 family endonuclease